MSLQLPKGTRDFLPEDKIQRDQIVSTLKKNFERFGFNPLETPALEMFETLAYAGGEEILKEMYSLEDNAQRKLGLRYDLTIPFARVIAMNPQLKMPFKRYQIDRVWRDGPIKLGRYREFWQCDCDIVGSSSMIADAECIALAAKVFTDLELDVEIKYNNRKLLNGILDSCGIEKEQQNSVILSLDKLEKISFSSVEKELREKNIGNDQIDKLQDFFPYEGSLDDLSKVFGDNPGLKELKELQSYLETYGVKNANFEISLARGLSYYTGTVYEVFLSSKEISSSLAAGGRYDEMIGLLAEKKEKVPAVGVSFGLDVIADVMKLKNTNKVKKTVVQVFIIPIKTEKECFELIGELRNNNIYAEMDLMGRGISKNLNYANNYSIPYVIIVGSDELAKQRFKLRDMSSGKEEDLTKDELIKALGGSR